MKILVIGQSLEDHINYKGKTTVKPGGIFYTVVGLKNFLESEDELLLLTSVEEKHLAIFSPLYDDIEKTYFSYVEKIPRVYLNITDENERGECYSLVNQNLSMEQVKDFKAFDGILINMITGYDITIDQLRKIRSQSDRPIFFDVHTLARGIDEDGTRSFRTIPLFEEWAENIDVLQVNEIEFSSLFSCDDKREIIKIIFGCGVKILIVTKGELGASVYYKKNEEIISTFVSSLKFETKNKVGCGDVFGAVFFYNYIKDKNIDKALKLANIAGGCAASYDKIENFDRLKKDVYERLG